MVHRSRQDHSSITKAARRLKVALSRTYGASPTLNRLWMASTADRVPFHDGRDCRPVADRRGGRGPRAMPAPKPRLTSTARHPAEIDRARRQNTTVGSHGHLPGFDQAGIGTIEAWVVSEGRGTGPLPPGRPGSAGRRSMA